METNRKNLEYINCVSQNQEGLTMNDYELLIFSVNKIIKCKKNKCILKMCYSQ